MTRRAWLVLVVVAITLTALVVPSGAPAAQAGRVTELVSSQPSGLHVFVGGRAWPDPIFTDDGKHAFFTGALAPGYARQLFEHSNGTTTLISTGPSAGDPTFTMCHQYELGPCGYGSSSDGSRVYFSTAQPLVTQDTDTGCVGDGNPSGYCGDVYERSGGSTRLVSIGPTGGNGPFDAGLRFVSRDGTRALFATSEPLIAADTDHSSDVYESVGDTLRLFPSNELAAGDTGPIFVHREGASADGARVLFSTTQSLSPADHDTCQDSSGRPVGCDDIYERTKDGLVLVSTGSNGGNGPFDVQFDGASADGSRVFFTTRESLVSGDSDSCLVGYLPPGCADIYERNLRTGTTTLVSTGPDGGNGLWHATFGAVSEDGSHVAFTTDESLLSSDRDSCTDYNGAQIGCADIYERSPDGLELASTGPLGGNGAFDADFRAMSIDGKRITFSTREALVGSDTDSCTSYKAPSGCQDVYQRSGRTTVLVSAGPTGGNGQVRAEFDGASADGRRIFFHTSESLVAADTDACHDSYYSGDDNDYLGCPDIYERFNGTTTLLSTGPSDTGRCLIGDGHQSGCPSFFAASTDGRRVFFGDSEPLVPADVNGPSGYGIYVSKVAQPGCRPDKPGHTPGKCAR